MECATRPVTLDLSHRGFKASECTLGPGLSLVGSATDSPVRLLDPAVSSTHCSLVATHLGTWVVDLLGKEGIQVNGTPVRHARLEPGDALCVGRSSIRIRPMPAAGTPPPPQCAIRENPVPVPDSDPRPSAPVLSAMRRRQSESEEERFAELSARERRSSCRYPVADAEAVLSWWEPMASPAMVLPAPGDARKPSEPEPESESESERETEESIYRRVMARWPASHNGTPAERAAPELVQDPLPAVEESMQSRISRARLLNLSQTGALVLSEAVPPAGVRVWLRLDTPQITDWVEVVLKGSAPAAAGSHRLRLAFREACPYGLFKAVVYNTPRS
jgi:hypothetical protein